MTAENKRNYVATFILDNRYIKESVDTVISKLTATIEAVQGEVSKVDNQGTKDFARAADKRFTSGAYVEMEFSGPTSAPAELKEKLRLDKEVDRILVLAA